MKGKLSNIAIIFGALFIVNAILGRYIVVPGYLESLEMKSSSDITSTTNIEGWKIARYLLWAYSFKFGIYFITIGVLLKTKMKNGTLSIYSAVGFIYICIAYLPIPGPSWVFGVGGVIMTVLIILLIWLLSKGRESRWKSTEISVDYKIAGYFFFAMATYNLCALLGTRCFALEPEKMIQYGLQEDAASFAMHILIELVLGWLFIFLSYLSISKQGTK